MFCGMMKQHDTASETTWHGVLKTIMKNRNGEWNQSCTTPSTHHSDVMRKY
jgi:hypothetical protein